MTLHKFLKRFKFETKVQIKVSNVGTVHTGAVIAIPAMYILKPYIVRKVSLEVIGNEPYLEITVDRPVDRPREK